MLFQLKLSFIKTRKQILNSFFAIASDIVRKVMQTTVKTVTSSFYAWLSPLKVFWLLNKFKNTRSQIMFLLKLQNIPINLKKAFEPTANISKLNYVFFSFFVKTVPIIFSVLLQTSSQVKEEAKIINVRPLLFTINLKSALKMDLHKFSMKWKIIKN